MHLKHGAALQGGKYRIEKLLGQGGFGITYLAVQTGLNRMVAIKEFFMKEHCNRDADTSRVSVPSVGSRELVAKFKEKFIKEAQMIYDLKHQNIILIRDFFEENGTAYYVMEYHDGGSLGSLPLPLTAEEASVYVRQVASALSYLHDRNTMHLDVKPSNVLIDKEGNAVLIDFGISKHYDYDGHQTSSTPVGISKGYAPIEQYSQSTLEFNPATDIYSLGATLYKLLTGDTPPEASLLVSNPKLLIFPSSVSEPMAALIRRCMSPSLDARPQSISEFLGLLDEALAAASVIDDTLVESEGDDDTVIAGGDIQDKDNGGAGKKDQSPSPKPKSLRWLWWLIALLVAFAGAASVLFIGNDAGTSDTVKTTGMHEGYYWVDLGLSVKWATCNVGASSPGDYGHYYAWGETDLKEAFYDYNSITYGELFEDIAGNPKFDVARSKWKGDWRMPTRAELQELLDECTWSWSNQNGHAGYEVTSKINGQSIFLPAAGSIYEERTVREGEEGIYWSSSPGENQQHVSYFLLFDDVHLDDERPGRLMMDWGDRLFGFSVRPVLGDSGKSKYSSIDVASDTIASDKYIRFANNILYAGDVEYPMISVKGAELDDIDSNTTSIINDFYIGKYEVTQGLWEAVMNKEVEQHNNILSSEWDMWGKGDNFPMYYISYEDAQEFCFVLNKITGLNFRLPTDLEWEYAARGGLHKDSYTYSGSNNIDDVAWYSQNSGTKSHEVGDKNHGEDAKLPNSLGIYDMSGNVLEWCDGALSSEDMKILRGGAYSYGNRSCKVADKGFECETDYRCYDYGFRLCL